MHLLPDLQPLIARHGYLVVGLVVGLESMGVPMPGETLLIAAAFYAAATGQLDIGWIVIAACTGAVMGDNLGYLVGRRLGAPALAKHGPRIGLHRRRLLLGQWLFLRFGGAVVFLGRFTALLRTFAALLAGANRMPWQRFLVWNALGGVVWACFFGYGAYLLGDQVSRLAWPVAVTVTVLAAGCIIGGGLMIRRHEATWLDRAEREMAVRANVRAPVI